MYIGNNNKKKTIYFLLNFHEFQNFPDRQTDLIHLNLC